MNQTYRPITQDEILQRRAAAEQAKLDAAIARVAAQNAGHLYIEASDRARIANRLMVQAPANESDKREFQRFMKERSRIAGIPADVLIRLEVLVDLAEKGNTAAAWIYTRECESLGITFPRRF